MVAKGGFLRHFWFPGEPNQSAILCRSGSFGILFPSLISPRSKRRCYHAAAIAWRQLDGHFPLMPGRCRARTCRSASGTNVTKRLRSSLMLTTSRGFGYKNRNFISKQCCYDHGSSPDTVIRMRVADWFCRPSLSRHPRRSTEAAEAGKHFRAAVHGRPPQQKKQSISWLFKSPFSRTKTQSITGTC